MACQTFNGETIAAAHAAMAGDDEWLGDRTCRTHGSWAYANGTIAYAFPNADGEVWEFYCADCAENRIRALFSGGHTDGIIEAHVLSAGDDDILCDTCGESLGN